MLIALTRDVSPDLGRCELTHLPRQSIDLAIARAQHEAYRESLTQLGYEIRRLPDKPELPDSVFIEDTCVVFPELAIITRPGADSRRPETPAVEAAMRPFRALRRIRAPATLDGGDVLCVGRRVFVGQTTRSNPAAVEQLRSFLDPYGYRVIPVPVSGCLHLKSAATTVAECTILVNPAWVDPHVFGGLIRIEVDPSEPAGGNALSTREAVVYPAAYPRTRKRLEEHGIRVATVDVSELSKAEGGVTCCSLLFEVEQGSRRMQSRAIDS